MACSKLRCVHPRGCDFEPIDVFSNSTGMFHLPAILVTASLPREHREGEKCVQPGISGEVEM